MAKDKKEEAATEVVQRPTVDDTVEKLKIKKPKKKKFEKSDNDTVKVDLNKLKEKAEEIIKVDLSNPTEETKAIEKIEVPEKPKTIEDTPVIEEITDDIKEPEIVEKKVAQPVENKIHLPENVEKLMSFMKDTGGDLNDYVKLNQDYSEMDNHTLLKKYYDVTKPHLKSDEIDFIMEDKFSYDEEVDGEKDVKRKKLAMKEQVAEAKLHLESVKSKYYEDIKMGSKLTGEQQNAVEFFERYNKESEMSQKVQEQAKSTFLNKTDNVFNEEFKGFEYKVGDKRYRFNVKDADSVKNNQSNINNFVKKFLNKDNQMEDAKGYHKALYTAMNSDAIANHFYEQGKVDALKESLAKSKNIDMDPRQSHGNIIEAGGIKVRALGDNSNDYKFKIKSKK